MPNDDRARRNAILGIDLLEQAAAEAQGSVGGFADVAAAVDVADGGAVTPSQAQDNRTPSPHYGALQAVVDELFEDKPDEYSVRRLDVVIAAESSDLPDELLELVNLLPPGEYSRKRLCTQLNSAIGGHAWGQVYGTVM